MKKIITLFTILSLGMIGFVSLVYADTQQDCGSNRSLTIQKGINNQFSSNCNNNSNRNSNNNSQSQSQSQDNNQNVTISLATVPTVAPAPVTTSLPSTGPSPLVYSLFTLLPLGFVVRKS